MKVFFFPSVSVALFLCLGIILQAQFSWALATICALFTGIGIAFIVFERNKNIRLASYCSLLFWAILGCLTHYLATDTNKPFHYTQQQNIDSKNEMLVVVTERLKNGTKTARYIAQFKNMNNHIAQGNVIITKPINEDIAVEIGSVLLIYAPLYSIEKSKNPYQFSYAAYLANQNLYGQIRLTASNYKNIGIQKNLNYYIEQLRKSLIQSFAIHQYPQNTQQFINAFLFGQRQELNKDLNKQYTQAGVVHILAISGLHIGILYGMVLLIFKALGLGHKQRYLKLVITLLFLGGFALLTGLSPSVIRCVTMFGVIALAMTFSRNANIYNAMALSLLLIALFNPNIIFEVGFQLSYLAVLCLVISSPLLKKLHITKNKILNYITDLLAISFLVQLFLLPLLLYYFNQFPLFFLLANLVVIPLATLLLYALVILVFLNYLAPGLAIIFGKLVGWFIANLNAYVTWIATTKYAVIQNIPFNKITFIAISLTIVILFCVFFKPNYKRVTLLLTSVLLSSILFGIVFINENKKAEFIVWNAPKLTLLTQEDNTEILVYTNNPDSVSYYTSGLLQNHFIKPLQLTKTPNYLLHQHKKIAIINDANYYNNGQATDSDYLILTQSPKINLERVIEMYQPKQIISDANNYKMYVERWGKTASKKNIPFYNTYKMGYYNINSN
ncbi:ComEC family competence protein [Flavobacterium agricola]|uniref:ComEC family competence protein n=1 Tax=Flavobacterium agricola TaxID=2870839 RepID=A0ABY6M300_9FLAO|nr:ComEC/Rec2 family competence protein [Flavobacterium agricola]UYW01328.1 ComEC family competence protein [Flavobacterium agricola]